MGLETIHLQSQHKGLKVYVTGGEMDFTQTKGRTPRVKEKQAAIVFAACLAVVERESTDTRDSAFWRSATWKDLKAKSRAEAVEAIRRLTGYGVDFTITDAVVEAGTREPAGAAAK